MKRLGMKRGRWGAVLGAALLPAFLGGCQSMSNTDKGVLAGGGLGAAAGALVGGSRGHAGTGALLGGALGAAAGGLTGAGIDKAERKAEARVAAAQAAARPPLSLQEIAELTAGGSSDAIIINQIRVGGGVYHLTGQDLLYLQQSGVREPVIAELQATAVRPPRAVYTEAPVYVVPGPPPPVGVGVGVTYMGGRRRW